MVVRYRRFGCGLRGGGRCPVKALVTFGSKRGGTAEVATAIAEALRGAGFEVDCVPARAATDVDHYDAIIVGGAVYARRWAHEARRFVIRHAAVLRKRPVWMFSSGPLDDSATQHELAPVRAVAELMARVGARGHATFGGRLTKDAKDFPASAMAKTRAGDWRDWARIRAWAQDIARDLADRPHSAPYRPPGGDRALAALCLAVGVTAIAGGTALVSGPDGRYARLPLSTLAHSPFTSFLIPGVLLLVVVGLGNLVAGTLVWRHHRRAHEAAFGAGVALWGWIVTEIVMLGTANLLQIIYLVISLAIVALAFRDRRPSSAGLAAAR